MSFQTTTTLDGAERRGASLLLEILEREGVQYIFGNPGTTELPLMDALLDTSSIQYILALQEASAVAMADGYAQASGKPGFLNLHTAGGLGHGMGNLLNASISQTPLVVTAGQQDSRHTITDPLLLGDLVKLAEPAVKWAQEVKHANELPILVPRAFNDAQAAPSGPVLLSLPMDVMEEISNIPVLPLSRIDRRSVAGGLGDLATALAGIEPGRLAMIAGDEIHACGAAGIAAEIAEMLAAPVFGSSWPSRIPFSTSHPLWSGNLPTKATAIAERLADFDAILALGGKSLITILYTEGPALPPDCAVYQLSSDVRDLGRTFPTPLSLVGDIKASLAVLKPMLQVATAPKTARYAAERQSAAMRTAARRTKAIASAEQAFDAPVIAPIVAAREVMKAVGPRIPIVDEAIATSNHVRNFLDSDWPAQYSFLRGGALGWGMPAAVGCSLGIGREPVLCLVGDGAALYSPQALWTAAHERLPVTFVVMNNQEYNVLKNFMRTQTHYSSYRSNRFIAMDITRPSINYQALGQSMGLPTVRITAAADIAPAVHAGLSSGQANLIEIIISAE